MLLFNVCIVFSTFSFLLVAITMLKHLQSLMKCSSETLSVNSMSTASVDNMTPCSGRGECLSGTCLCEIRYTGDECDNFNLPYHAGTLLCRTKNMGKVITK